MFSMKSVNTNTYISPFPTKFLDLNIQCCLMSCTTCPWTCWNCNIFGILTGKSERTALRATSRQGRMLADLITKVVTLRLGDRYSVGFVHMDELHQQLAERHVHTRYLSQLPRVITLNLYFWCNEAILLSQLSQYLRAT